MSKAILTTKCSYAHTHTPHILTMSTDDSTDAHCVTRPLKPQTAELVWEIGHGHTHAVSRARHYTTRKLKLRYLQLDWHVSRHECTHYVAVHGHEGSYIYYIMCACIIL